MKYDQCSVCLRTKDQVIVNYAGAKCRSCHEKEDPKERRCREEKRATGAAYRRSKEYRKNRSAEFRQLPDYEIKWQRYYLKYKYGLSVEEYNRMTVEQNNVCAICRQPNRRRRDKGRLIVDHCHDTDKVRALVCHNCNAALGMADDDPELLESLADYLRKHGK